MKTVSKDRPNQISKRAERHALQLLALPRMQAAIAELFMDAGLGPDAIVREIAQIATGPDKPEVRLRALDMAVRMTTGYAPTKSINANFNGDKLFDPKTFGDGVPPEID